MGIKKYQKIFGNPITKAKRKAWEEKQGLETYNKKIANNGTNYNHWNNPVNENLLKKKKFLEEGSKEAKAELREIHRNNIKYGDIRRNLSKKVIEKHTDYGGMWGMRRDEIGALVEGGEDSYNRIMKERSGERRKKHQESKGIRKNKTKLTSSLNKKSPEILKSQGTKKLGSVLGGIRKRIGEGLRKVSFR